MKYNEVRFTVCPVSETANDIIAALAMEMGLESGDYGIEEPLRFYFRNEYQYINKLAKYLKQWVRTIKLKDVKPRTSFIDKANKDYYVTFNYTSVLENVYKIQNVTTPLIPPQQLRAYAFVIFLLIKM